MMYKPYKMPFSDIDNALDQYFLRDIEERTDADRAIIVKYLISQQQKNADIRYHLGIKRDYIVSRLILAAKLTNEELALWHKHPDMITLGHIRVIVNLPEKIRCPKLKSMVSQYVSVRELISWRDEHDEGDESNDEDTKRYERLMSEHIQRAVRIKYNSKKKTGNITLPYYGLSDLDDIAKALGFDFNKANEEQ